MNTGTTQHERPGRPSVVRPRVVGMAVEPRYRAQAQPAGLLAALRAAGQVHVVELVAANAGDFASTLEQCDLVVARGRSAALVRLLAQAETLGIPTVNRPDAITSVVDKVVMQERLVAAGVPVPYTWVGPMNELRAQLRGYDRALVVKPVRGDNCRDVYVVADGEALATQAWNEPTAIVQDYIANSGFDVKLYGIGERVWSVRKPSPIHADAVGAMTHRLTATPEHVALAHRCRDAFGLDLYGVDCIQTADGLVVIEVNDFPNYSGIADANAALSAFVVGQLQHELVVV